MKKRLTRISPLQAGIVIGAMYGIFSLIVVPFLMLAMLFGGRPATSVFLMILFPVLYAAAGFVVGIVSALIYNLIASLTGGLEFDLVDAPR